jgi:tetratricopeptide (TPR) repeat protein
LSFISRSVIASGITTVGGKYSMRLIVSVHGIRTFGDWQGRLEQLVHQDPRGRDAVIINYNYGYFSVIAFLIPFLRWIAVRRFRVYLLDCVSRQQWNRIDLVGHSFGTHIIAWALYGIPPHQRPEVHTVLLAGSVLKGTFPWHTLLGHGVTRVINDCGTRDTILLLSQFFVLFTGMAGRLGFSGGISSNFCNRFFQYGHSGYFLSSAGSADDTFMRRYWLDLLLSDAAPETVDERDRGALTGIKLALINNAEPIKLAIYLVPLVAWGALMWSWYHNAEVQRLRAETMLKVGASAADGLVAELAQEFRDREGVPSALIRQLLLRARDLIEGLSQPGDDRLAAQRGLTLIELAHSLQRQGDPNSALELAKAADHAFVSIAKSNAALALEGRTAANDRQGDAAIETCDYDQAEKAYGRALDFAEKRWALLGRPPAAAGNVAVAEEKVGDILLFRKQLMDALTRYERAMHLREQIVELTRGQIANLRSLSVSYQKVADIYGLLGRQADAARYYDKSLEIDGTLASIDPGSSLLQRDLSLSYQDQGDLAQGAAKLEKALELYSADLTIKRRLAKSDAARIDWQRDLVASLVRVADQHLSLGNPESFSLAIDLYREAVRIADVLAQRDQNCPAPQRVLANIYQRIARTLEKQKSPGAVEEAIWAYRKSIAIRTALLRTPRTPQEWNADIIGDYSFLGELLLQSRQAQEAVREGLTLLELARTTPLQDVLNAKARVLGSLAWYRIHAGEYSKALADAQEACQLYPDSRWIELNLAHALMFAGNSDAALKAYDAYAHNAATRPESLADIQSDFKALRERGRTHLLMRQVEVSLGIAEAGQ